MVNAAQIIIPVFYIVFSIAFLVSSWDLPFRATILPQIVISAIILIAGFLLVRDIFRITRSRSETKREIQTVEVAIDSDRPFPLSFFAPELLRPVISLLLLCLYVYLSRWVNFYLLSFLFLMAQCFVIGVTWRQLPGVIAVMTGFTIFAYYFFELLLEIPF